MSKTNLKSLSVLKINDDEYVLLKEVQELISSNELKPSIEEEWEAPNIGSMLKNLFRLKSFYIAVVFLLLLSSGTVSPLFGYSIEWPTALFELIKVGFIILSVYVVAKTANFYFKTSSDNYDSNVPSPKKIIYLVSQSFLTYVILSSFLFIFSVNFEALGVELMKDALGAFVLLMSFLGIVVYILYNWFTPIFNFFVSSNSTNEDFVGQWFTLDYKNKLWTLIILILGILFILTELYGYLSVL